MTDDGSDSSSLVEFSVNAGQATITLNRPERHNSLTPALTSELLEALNRAQVLGQDQDIHSVVLRAEGSNFSTGGDVAAFLEAGTERADYARLLVGQLNQAILAILHLSVPVICRVQGIVTGGSLGFVLASDLVVATDETWFAPFYSVVGFAPDGGWSAILPDVIGINRTREIQLLNRKISAQQAQSWGLINSVVPQNGLDDQVQQWQHELAGKVQSSLACTKQTLRTENDLAQIEARLELERQTFVEQIVKPEVEQGMQRFLNRS
ncbi:enoyl-CoA hydratase/isomerase family protein [Pseudomaricurvus alkylphenolicus]|jgi:2-(1,2-epoxy-1,2-dihydrophenyl)acetyl-CoA isomerase|uniref:enoyl-CoA hydratase/isomerase family protein n=1 Tax=Pseudomaricurvus alkylphenolicus TaxID=1306991 RepID=UPI00141F754C|nr:enoyl-CoA hydratase/isomerase family protein [Pseudomaricurvus alkylphenolicus]NIB41763.1 enoyl-CoA hydratase/isomerase family protein [Pseudomaricurvus alkylphenolicus]